MPAFVSPAPLTNSNNNTSELATANNEWLRSRMTGRLAATASPPPPASPSATPSNGSASASASMLPAVWRYLHPGHLRAAAAAAVATATASVNSNLSANNQATTPNRLPTDLPRDPRLWSRDDVRRWLLWCQDEFDLPPIDVNQFPMNGKALCLLMKSDFFERTPRAGDVLYNAIHLLLMEATSCGNEDLQAQRYDRQLRMYGYTGGTLISSELPHAGPWTTAWPFVGDYHNLSHMIQQSQQQQLDFTTNGSKVGNSAVTLSPARSTDSHSESSSHDDSSGNRNGRSDRTESMDAQVDSSHHSESGESEMESPPPPLLSPKCPTPTSNHSEAILTETSVAVMEQPVTNGRLLWDFLHQLLNDPAQRYIRCIMWKEKETGVFKIVDPHGLAQLWGMQKNHLNMNFDKMSRALRYYYRVNILRKVQGERHCYQFLRQPTELKACKQRALLTKYCGNLQSSKQDSIADHPITIKCEVGNV